MFNNFNFKYFIFYKDICKMYIWEDRRVVNQDLYRNKDDFD